MNSTTSADDRADAAPTDEEFDPNAPLQSDSGGRNRKRAALAVAPFLAIGLGNVVLLLGWGIDRPVEDVFDPPGTGGPVGGILAAARATEAERIAVVGCDMPLVTTEAIRWLAGQSADADAIVPVDEGGQLQPVFAVYRTTAVTAAESRLTSAALFGLLDELDVHRVPIESAPAELGVDRALTNVNTPVDLKRLRERSDSSG